MLREWLTTEVQSIILQSGLRRVFIEAGWLQATVRSPGHDPSAITAALDAITTLVAKLPQAIGAAGCGAYLASGSLAAHPDVLTLNRFERRSTRVWGCALAAFLLFILGGAAAWFAACTH